MPKARIDPTLEMHYESHDFTDPWKSPQTVVLVHGVAESSRVWWAWVPRLAREYRVVRPDMRGFGQSSEPPQGYQWSLSGFAHDISILLDQLGLARVHLVGAKLGGTIVMQFAAQFPERLRSLVVVGGPVKLTAGSLDTAPWVRIIEEQGVEAWARHTMGRRLGPAEPAMMEWWIKLMGQASPRVVRDIVALSPSVDITEVLPQIRAPTLMITAEASALAPVETVRQWQQLIPNAELLVLPSTSYHIAATMPDECASATLEFIHRFSA